jgi:hypothetical protein
MRVLVEVLFWASAPATGILLAWLDDKYLMNRKTRK